ncbi:MFS transporter [Roseobacter sp. HKCCA0434]|uniref:MFS transporter n=1 Tax=Roseobacter sp. HKCCA0434 TaxID=3079297 RepID=UPI002905E4ED|nr:MFS transporter [Roseobacter sp. HKCCA0434]
MLTAILSLGNFAVGMGVFVAIGLLEPIRTAFGLGVAEAGLILTVYAVTYAIGSPVLVALTGRQSRRQVMSIGLGLFALSAATMALAPNAPVMFLARAMAALGAGLFTPITASVAAAVSAPDQQGASLARVFAGLTFAQVLGVPVGTRIGYAYGWEVAFWIVAILSLACLVAIRRFVPEDLRLSPTGLGDLVDALADWRALLTISFTATFLGGIYVLYTYLAPISEDRMGYAGDGVTTVFAIFGVGAVLGNFVGGWTADRIGPRRTLALLCLSQVVLMPVFAFLPMPQWAFLSLVLVWAISGWSFMASQQIRVVGASGGRPAVGLALNAAAIYVGSTLGATLGQILIARFGLDALGFGGAALALIAFLHLASSERLAARRLGNG